MVNASGWPRRGLYAITPDEDEDARLLARVEPVLAAGAALLQYRNKRADAAVRRRQARALLPLCRRFGVPLIVNDDIELAAAIGAAGVHLGEDDADLRQARARLGAQAIVGASCYDELARAERACTAGASYLAFGACYPSATKPGTRRATPELLAAAGRFGLPRVAIGGLRPDNAAVFVTAGADLLAVVGGLFDAPDPAAAARAFIDCFKESPG